MEKIPPMVDLKLTEQGAEQEYPSTPDKPVYPYGLCISLCENELDKLGYSADDFMVGDMLHLHCMANVTSVSKNETQHGVHSRIELQITHISAESEDEENEEVAPKKRDIPSKLYTVR